MRSLRLAVLLVRLSARPFQQRAALAYSVILLVAGFIFGPTGMQPRDLTSLAARHPLFDLSLWAVWLVATGATARALLVVPEAFYLRSLPAPRMVLAAVPATLLFVAQLPWGVLWAIGEGPVAGLWHAAGAAAAQAIWVAGVRRPVEVPGPLLLAAAVAFPVAGPVRLAMAAAALAVSGATVFRRAPEVAASTGRSWVRGRAPTALAIALLTSLSRAEPAVLVRGLALLLLGGVLAALGVRNNHVTVAPSLARVLLAVGAPPLAAALVAIGGAALRAERRAEWLLGCCGATPSLRIASLAIAVGAVGLLGGTAHAATVTVGAGVVRGSWARLLGDGALLGGLLGACAASLPRLAGEGRTAPDRLLGMALALAVGASLVTSLVGEAGLPALALLALWLGAAALRVASPVARIGAGGVP